MICFCCNDRADKVTMLEGLPVCPVCMETTFIIYDCYLGVYVVYPEGKMKEYNAMREYAKRYLDTFAAQKDINTNLSGHERFKIIRYDF